MLFQERYEGNTGRRQKKRCIIKNPISLKTSDVSEESLREVRAGTGGGETGEKEILLSDTHANVRRRLSTQSFRLSQQYA